MLMGRPLHWSRLTVGTQAFQHQFPQLNVQRTVFFPKGIFFIIWGFSYHFIYICIFVPCDIFFFFLIFFLFFKQHSQQVGLLNLHHSVSDNSCFTVQKHLTKQVVQMFVSKNVLKGYFCMCLSLPLNNCTPIKPLKTMCCLWFGLFFPQFYNYTYDNAVMGAMGLDDN